MYRICRPPKTDKRVYFQELSSILTLLWRRSLSYRNQPTDFSANQGTGLYMIGTSTINDHYGTFVAGDTNINLLIPNNTITNLTYFLPMCHIYTPWKHQKTLRFSDIFRGYRSGTLVENGLIKTYFRSNRGWLIDLLLTSEPRNVKGVLFVKLDCAITTFRSTFAKLPPKM